MKYASIYFASNEQIQYPKFNFAQKNKKQKSQFLQFQGRKKIPIKSIFPPNKISFENIFFRIASDP